MGILDEYMGYADDSSLTESERAAVRKIVNSYNALDVDLFIKRIGGMDKLNEMKKINERADRLRVVGGKVMYKPENNSSKEDIDEWKKGFMDGFEEAYKRFNSLK